METWPNPLGSAPAITAAVRANAGSTRLGRPNASAANTLLPIIAARTTDTGSPLVRAYIQMTANGASQ